MSSNASAAVLDRSVYLFDARRWTRVTSDGVRVRLPLTHQTLGQIVGACRPTVSLALGQLSARGEVRRQGDEWVLRNDPDWRDRTAMGEALSGSSVAA